VLQLIKEGPGIGAHRGAYPRGCRIMDFVDHPRTFSCPAGTTELVRIAPVGYPLVCESPLGESRQLLEYGFSDGIQCDLALMIVLGLPCPAGRPVQPFGGLFLEPCEEVRNRCQRVVFVRPAVSQPSTQGLDACPVLLGNADRKSVV